MNTRILSLQTEEHHHPALVFGDRVMRSPIDGSVVPWKSLPAQALFNNQYRTKPSFLTLSQLLIDKLGKPTSACLLADTIIGVGNWSNISIAEQYSAIQENAAVFEASSMTYLGIKGPDAETILDNLTPRNIRRLKPDQSLFAIFTTPSGTVDDDALILKVSENEFLLSCGGSKLPQHTLTYLPQVLNQFPNAIVSFPDLLSFNIKGPKRIGAMLNLLKETEHSKVNQLQEFQFCHVKTLNDDTVIVVKTKIGIEMWGNLTSLKWAWQHMLDHREIFTPCAWDVLHTFRMECEELVLSVYPIDIHGATNLWEIGCGWMTQEKESSYIGQEALNKNQKVMQLKKIKAQSGAFNVAKVGTVLYKENGEFAGFVTSSAYSIKEERALAFAHLLMDVGLSDKLIVKNNKEEWVIF